MNTTNNNLKVHIEEVYSMLQSRKIHPSGKFDNAKRFYATNGHLINVREPSRAYPFSQMSACRTRKYIKAVVEHFKCETKEDILKHI